MSFVAFPDWLTASLDRDDAVGRVAAFVAGAVVLDLAELPDADGFGLGDFAAWLRDRGAPADVLTAADATWRAWEHSRRQDSPRLPADPGGDERPATVDEEAEAERLAAKFGGAV